MAIGRTVVSSYHFESSKKHITVPFELDDSAAFLQVRIGNSRPLWFEIDSGSAASYLDRSAAKEIGLESHGKKLVQGAGAGKVEVDLYHGVEFNLPGLRSSNHTVHGVNLQGIGQQLGRPLHGLFGNDFLERFTVTIDYPKRSIKIEEPSDYNYTGPGVQVPLEFKGPLPYARATIHIQGNPPVEDLFLVDSGSSDEVDHPLIAKSRAGTETAPGGIGLGTPIEARLGRVDLLELGPFKIRGATGIATESGLGSRLIGAGVLSRFKVIFDYQRSRMFLEEETGQ